MLVCSDSSSPASFFVDEIENTRKQGSRRKNLFGTLAGLTGKIANSLRVAAHRQGLTSERGFNKCTLSPEEEEALIIVCLVHAREGVQ